MNRAAKPLPLAVDRPIQMTSLRTKGDTIVTQFIDRLATAIQAKGNPVLVGLDPRAGQLPRGILAENEKSSQAVASAYVTFCQGIIDVVAPLVAVVKPQAAFFEQLGPAGMVALGAVIDYAQQQGLLVLLDGKRNDIGSTATAYAQGLLGGGEADGYHADALTVSPYLGSDSLSPFVDIAKQRSCGVYVLVKTSNPGGKTFQDLVCDGRPLYRHVGALVESLAEESLGECKYGDVGAVVGATYPEQLAELRAAMPRSWFLVPGFGAQGGTAEDVAGAFDAQGLGAIINSSRGIIFAHSRPEYTEKFGDANWQQAVEAATLEMIEILGRDTPAGALQSH